jgi:predicted nuclease of restriction endonuclease-like (RecB) superfamily
VFIVLILDINKPLTEKALEKQWSKNVIMLELGYGFVLLNQYRLSLGDSHYIDLPFYHRIPNV